MEINKVKLGDSFDQPDESWELVEGDVRRAACSVWTKNGPVYKQFKTALIGNFFASDRESGIKILEYTLSRLRGGGMEYVLGPMDGSTWRSYRLVTEIGESPPFFLEPSHPDFWPRIFLDVGFEEIATYCSTKADHTDYSESRINKLIDKMKKGEIEIRSFDLSHAERDLRKVYELSINSFSRNFLYTPISFESFLSLYQPVLPYVNPDYFLIAERKGEPVGFIFAIPDFSQKQEGKEIDTVIIKTVARAPERLYAGLGSYLVYEINRRAALDGKTRMIHALMHEANSSLSISKKLDSQLIRKYALYGVAL